MIEQKHFGTTVSGAPVNLFTLKNSKGMSVEVLDYGGIIRAINVPKTTGEQVDVALGYDTFAEYEADDSYQGAIIGRWANRIAGAAFTLKGRTYHLAANNGNNHIHGGPGGFHQRLWQADAAGNALTLTRLSPDGEEGFPGNLTVRVIYELSEHNELILRYEARSDSDTALNLTNHTYFNLTGGGDILGHELQLNADLFSPVNEELIPLGHLSPVSDTPFDFRRPKAIGRDIEKGGEQLERGGGYDHNFAQRPESFGEPFAVVRAGGICLTAFTTLPGVQFYSGNFLREKEGKGGQKITRRSGFCLETQLFPDSINQAPQTAVLKRGALYQHRTVYRFGAY